MTTSKTTRTDVTDSSPLYAVVGLTDVVVEKMREAGETALRVGANLRPQSIGHQVNKVAGEVTKQVEAAPGAAVGGAMDRAGKVAEGYAELAARGEHLVDRVRNQAATKELMAQVDSAVKQGKALLATAREGAANTQSAAKATVTTGRREVAEAVSEVVAGKSVESTTKATPAIKSTARKPATKSTTKSAAKSTTGSAAKPATKSTRKAAPSSGAKATTKTTKPAATGGDTGPAAKRTVTTARNRAAETASVAADAAGAAGEVVSKAAEAAGDAAEKVGK